ncbi:MAG: hypothetical protein EPO07_13155 [Verrucomicrobia bacterium]|nr:MAG: hypothetical protein EPO07_13155 [Verrucomicrobiota bacterium]
MSHIVVEDEERKSGGQWKGIVAALLVLALIGLGAWKFGAKWYRRIKAVADIAAAAGQASVTASDDAPPEPHNLWEEDCVVLFVKHTNHTEVAEAFVKHWQEKYKKRLTINKVEAEEWRAGEYQVFPAHNGYVRIIGSLEWTQAQYEELAQHLSQQFNGYVFETRDVDFSGAFHFGVYEQGARKFHAQMDFVMKNGEPDEVVSTEGDDWALAHGFKPGEQGVKGFNMVDADRITQKLGMKMYDEQSGDQEVPILLRDFAANPGKIPARVPARLVGPSSMED